MTKSRFLALVALLALAALTVAPQAYAQAQAKAQSETLDEYVKTIRQDLSQRRDSTLQAVMQLTEEEAKTFWPLKEKYDAEMDKLQDQRRELLREWGEIYNELEPAKANSLAERFFALDARRNELHRKYFYLMSADVSVVDAVQFLQLNSQFETMGDVKLATYVPLAVK